MRNKLIGFPAAAKQAASGKPIKDGKHARGAGVGQQKLTQPTDTSRRA
jgi:hypothetical protein